MKKWIAIGFIGFLAVFIIIKQLNSNEFSASKQLAESGKYEEFYASIQNEIENGNSDAKEILVEYFFKAIDDEDVEEVKFYLEYNRNLIDSYNGDGSRAIDLILITDEKINIDLLHLLLSYSPSLNYKIILDGSQLTFTEKATMHCLNAKNGLDALTILLKNGMNLNNTSNYNHGRTKYHPLILSYVLNNLEVFELFLNSAIDINPIIIAHEKEYSFVAFIMDKYVQYIYKNGAKLEHPPTPLLYQVLKHEEYKNLHQKNMKYFEALLKVGLLENSSEQELKNIFVYFASIGEIDAIQLFVNYGICNTYQQVCDLAIAAAEREKFHNVENIIKRGKQK
jgi:hypothetical protein